MTLKSFWYRFTDRYPNTILHPQYFIKKYSMTSIDLAVKYAKGTLLDIGCGRMPYKNKFVKKTKKYIGVDHPKTSILYKSLYSGYQKPDIIADATNIPLKNSHADTIICMQVIEHTPDPEAAISEMTRLLKKNGHLIISTVQSYPLHNEPYDYRRFTKYGLKQIIKKHRLRVVKVKEEGNVFVTNAQNFNIYLMLILKQKVEMNNIFFLLTVAPFIFALITFINVITLPFVHLDKGSKFRILETIVAKK